MADKTDTSPAPIAPSVPVSSQKVVVYGLVFVLILVIAGVIYLSIMGKDVPTELSAIAMPIITALAALLSPVGQSK